MDLRREGGLKIKVALLMSGSHRRGQQNHLVSMAKLTANNANKLKFWEHWFHAVGGHGTLSNIRPGPQPDYSIVLNYIEGVF